MEDLQSKASIQLRIVDPSPPERPVLVVLDQMVVGVAGERQRVEPEGVHGRKLEQPQVRVGGSQVGQVEVDQVVAQHETGAVSQIVQPGQRLGQAATAMDIGERHVRVRPQAGQGMDPLVDLPDLQIQRQ